MARKGNNTRAVLTTLIVVFLACALAPASLTGWLGKLRGPVLMITAPLSSSLSRASHTLRPPVARFPDETSPTVESLMAELNYVRGLHQNLLAQNRDLARLVEDLSRIRVTAAIPIRPVSATRVGSDLGSGTATFRPGQRGGITVNGVAVVRGGQQIVGLVTRASPMVSTVHLLTDERFQPGLVVGVATPTGGDIESPEAFERLPRAQFRPTGKGTYAADQVPADVAERMNRGDTIRVYDDTWPKAAQLQIVGRITDILQTDEPLFRRVVVTPEIDPRRVRSVLILMPDDTTEVGG